MKNKLFFFLLYQLTFLAWCFKLHNHFFEFTIADQAGLTIASLMPLFLLRLDLQREVRFIWIVCTLLPIGILPVIEIGLTFFSDVWIFLYASLFISGCSILLSLKKVTFLLGALSVAIVWFLPYSFQKNQSKYYDLLNETITTRYGEVDLVSWKNDQWIYYNSSLVSSTADGHMHTETLVHTTLPFFEQPSVLLIGDDFGLTKEEIGKYPCDLTHLPYDAEVAMKMTRSADPSIPKTEILQYLESVPSSFDIIIIDLPDPEHLAFRHFYQEFFYQKCVERLTEDGILMTNAGGYYSNEKYYRTIDLTLQNQHLETEILQALIPTLGHRVWVMASPKRINLEKLSFDIATTWIDANAIQLMLAEGKESYPF